jgi:2-dehydro-3-deoxygluconokinase
MSLKAGKTFLSIGECMVELSGGEGGMFRLGFAGDTLNTAWYARSALSPEWEVAYFTAAGDDRYSKAMRSFLEEGGISTRLIQTIAGKRPGLYIIHQEAGDRHFTYWRDNSAARLLADDAELLLNAASKADAIYVSGITLAILKPARRNELIAVMEGARDDGKLVAFDPNIRPALWPDVNDMRSSMMLAASASSIVLPTFSDDAPFFGDRSAEHTVRRYLEAGAREVVVKDGPNPVHVSTGRNSLFVSVELVDNIVDATGAGDAFNGAYLAARLAGSSPETSTRAGNRTAAKVIGHMGALLLRPPLDTA